MTADSGDARTLSVYRVQASDGRGPWRPGFSHCWIEADAPAARLMETVMDLMPISEIRALPPMMHYGCACRTLNSLLAWFTESERGRLQRLGFYPVRMHVDRVLAESQYQLFIARIRPFTEGASRMRWEAR